MLSIHYNALILKYVLIFIKHLNIIYNETNAILL
jgi:hypothetical protein